MSKSPSLRRIQADIRELALDPSDRYHAAPMENDMFEWHFTIRGADGTDFEGGIYHGRILLPPDYPYKPPHIMFLTPSGRFETNTKVCLSFSAYHPELWQPAWGIRLILEALISFLPTPADGAIGALDWSSTERKKLALKSQSYKCACCGPIVSLLPKLKPKDASSAKDGKGSSSRFQKEIEQLQLLQQQEHRRQDDEDEVKAGERSAVAASEDESPPPSSSSGDGVATSSKAAAPPPPAAAREAAIAESVRDDAAVTPPEEEVGTQRTEQSPLLDDAALPGWGETFVHMEDAKIPPVERNIDNDASFTAAAPAGTGEEEGSATALPHDATAGAAEDDAEVLDDEDDDPAVSAWWDPLMQVGVLLLSVICYLLTQQVQQTWDELQRLQASLGDGDGTGA